MTKKLASGEHGGIAAVCGKAKLAAKLASHSVRDSHTRTDDHHFRQMLKPLLIYCSTSSCVFPLLSTFRTLSTCFLSEKPLIISVSAPSRRGIAELRRRKLREYRQWWRPPRLRSACRPSMADETSTLGGGTTCSICFMGTPSRTSPYPAGTNSRAETAPMCSRERVSRARCAARRSRCSSRCMSAERAFCWLGRSVENSKSCARIPPACLIGVIS